MWFPDFSDLCLESVVLPPEPAGCILLRSRRVLGN